MIGAFESCRAFNQPLYFDTSSLQTTMLVFQDAYAFNQRLAHWTMSSVTTLAEMFRRAYSFDRPRGRWDTSSVTSMLGTFHDAASFGFFNLSRGVTKKGNLDPS